AAATLARFAAATPAIEQRQLAAEARQHDLGDLALLAVLVGVLPALDAALQVDLAALTQVLLRNLAQLLVEDGDAVPLRALLTLAVLVLPALGGGDGEGDYLHAGLHVPRLGIAP